MWFRSTTTDQDKIEQIEYLTNRFNEMPFLFAVKNTLAGAILVEFKPSTKFYCIVFSFNFPAGYVIYPDRISQTFETPRPHYKIGSFRKGTPLQEAIEWFPKRTPDKWNEGRIGLPITRVLDAIIRIAYELVIFGKYTKCSRDDIKHNVLPGRAGRTNMGRRRAAAGLVPNPRPAIKI